MFVLYQLSRSHTVIVFLVCLFLLACDAVIYAFSRHDVSVTFTQFKQETGAMFPFFLALHMSHTRQAQHDTNEKKNIVII